MVWFKVDDGLPSSRKVLSIPRAKRCQAVGLWTLAGAWCSGELTDGRLPGYMLEELGGTKALAHLLIEAGLWVEDGSDYVFHDWEEYQPTSEDVKTKRKKNAERLALWREKNKGGNAVGNAVTPSVSNADVTQPPTRPDPTRPDPLVKEPSAPPSRFAEFWAAYPIKKDRANAEKAYTKQIKAGASHDQIMAGLATYVRLLATPGAPAPKYAQGWLNGKRWEDEADPVPVNDGLDYWR